MEKLSKQEQEWADRLDESTDPQEIMELGKKLKSTYTPEVAAQVAELQRQLIAERSSQESR